MLDANLRQVKLSNSMTYATTNLGQLFDESPRYVRHQFEPMDVCEVFGSTLERTPRPGDGWKSPLPIVWHSWAWKSDLSYFFSSFFRMLFQLMFGSHLISLQSSNFPVITSKNHDISECICWFELRTLHSWRIIPHIPVDEYPGFMLQDLLYLLHPLLFLSSPPPAPACRLWFVLDATVWCPLNYWRKWENTCQTTWNSQKSYEHVRSHVR